MIRTVVSLTVALLLSATLSSAADLPITEGRFKADMESLKQFR